MISSSVFAPEITNIHRHSIRRSGWFPTRSTLTFLIQHTPATPPHCSVRSAYQPKLYLDFVHTTFYQFDDELQHLQFPPDDHNITRSTLWDVAPCPSGLLVQYLDTLNTIHDRRNGGHIWQI
jgi:hypothetical protein